MRLWLAGGLDGASWYAEIGEEAPFDVAHAKARESLRRLPPSEYETNAAKLEAAIDEAHIMADIMSASREEFTAELKVLDNLRTSCVLGHFMAIFDDAAKNDATARKSFVHQVENKAKKTRADRVALPKFVRARADSAKAMK